MYRKISCLVVVLAKRISQGLIEMVSCARVIYSQYDSAILNLLLASHTDQIHHHVQFIFSDEISSQMWYQKDYRVGIISLFPVFYRTTNKDFRGQNMSL